LGLAALRVVFAARAGYLPVPGTPGTGTLNAVAVNGHGMANRPAERVARDALSGAASPRARAQAASPLAQRKGGSPGVPAPRTAALHQL